MFIAEPSNIPAAKFLTAKGLEKYNGLVERDFDTLNCLNTLQSIYNGAKTQKLRSLDNHMMKEFTNITNAFIDSLKIYASRLAIRTPNKYNPGTESKILSEELAKNTAHNNLHGSSDGHLETTLSNEKLIYERQLLAVIAILCTDFQNTTPALLFEKCEDSSSYTAEDDEMDGENRIGSFVDILTDVFCTIGYAVCFEQILKFNTCIISILLNFFHLEKSIVSQKSHRIGFIISCVLGKKFCAK